MAQLKHYLKCQGLGPLKVIKLRHKIQEGETIYLLCSRWGLWHFFYKESRYQSSGTINLERSYHISYICNVNHFFQQNCCMVFLLRITWLFVCLVCGFMSQSTAMLMVTHSIHLTTLSSLASLTKRFTSTSCTYFQF